MKLKKIKQKFKKNGYSFKLLKRIDDYALYSLSRSEGGKIFAYEIHKVRVTPYLTIEGLESPTVYTHYEKLPSNEEFGTYGWTYPTLDLVYKHFPQFNIGDVSW